MAECLVRENVDSCLGSSQILTSQTEEACPDQKKRRDGPKEILSVLPSALCFYSNIKNVQKYSVKPNTK